MINKTENEITSMWDNNKPMVSIRCVSYNHERYIAQCLDGFLMQETDFPFEIVVHDDASKDNTAKIIKIYAEKYPHIIKTIIEKENVFQKNPNEFMDIINQKCTGKYIALCEGDDYWTAPNKLQCQYDILEENAEYIIIFNKVAFVDVHGNSTGLYAPPDDKWCGEFNIEDYMNLEFKEGQWAIHTSSFFMKTSTWLEFCEARKGEYSVFPYGDMAVVIYCLMRGNGYIIPEVMGCYRQMSGGYNSYIAQNSDFAIKQEKKLIKALIFINDITKSVYNNQIEQRTYRAKMIIAMRGRFHKDFFQLLGSSSFDMAYNCKGAKKVIKRLGFLTRMYVPQVADLYVAMKRACLHEK